MKIILESTDKIVRLALDDGNEVPARIWQGQTESGIEVHAYITRVAVKNGQAAEAYRQFECELVEHVQMRPDVQGIPLRLIL